MMTGAKMEIEEVMGGCEALPLLSLNHVSLMCRSVRESVRFYEDVLGFVLIKRPSSFDFNGAWLYNYGIGIHLIENPSIEENDAIDEPRPINPKDNHMSFQVMHGRRASEEETTRDGNEVRDSGGGGSGGEGGPSLLP
ncbi:hypothetical protein EUGRSUZ_J02400 [Eucalyptus grandis]|uniref:Uncharacterized protein n=2 Tax=Eucalyptus grandis TaxID=71139 RepID=A0ACC3J8V9_EUCGR|nr:hypothetical protein EUGRSUZ_J02400 [Eucalyptus grandis]